MVCRETLFLQGENDISSQEWASQRHRHEGALDQPCELHKCNFNPTAVSVNRPYRLLDGMDFCCFLSIINSQLPTTTPSPAVCEAVAAVMAAKQRLLGANRWISPRATQRLQKELRPRWNNCDVHVHIFRHWLHSGAILPANIILAENISEHRRPHICHGFVDCRLRTLSALHCSPDATHWRLTGVSNLIISVEIMVWILEMPPVVPKWSLSIFAYSTSLSDLWSEKIPPFASITCCTFSSGNGPFGSVWLVLVIWIKLPHLFPFPPSRQLQMQHMHHLC